MNQKGKLVDATSLSLKKSPLTSNANQGRMTMIQDNNLTLTYNGGKLPCVKYNFDKIKLQQHVKMYALSKKIEKIKVADRASAQQRQIAYEDKNKKKKYKSLSHQRRIEIIYLRHVHKVSLRKIAKIIGSKPTAVRDTIIAYDQFGRTNKLLTYTSKKMLLDLRNRDCRYKLKQEHKYQRTTPKDIFDVSDGASTIDYNTKNKNLSNNKSNNHLNLFLKLEDGESQEWPKQFLSLKKSSDTQDSKDQCNETNFESVHSDVEKVDFIFHNDSKSRSHQQIQSCDQYIQNLRRELFETNNFNSIKK